MKSLLLIPMAMLAATVPLQADNFYLQANMPGSESWDTTTAWFDQTSGGGANPGTFAGNDFFTNGFRLRSAATTFGGDSLTLGSGGGDLFSMYVSAGQTSSVGNFTSLGGGTIDQSRGGVTSTFEVATFHMNGDTTINIDNGRGIIFDFDTLDGSGDFSFVDDGFAYFNVTDGSGYSGNLTWGLTSSDMTLEFTNSLSLAGGLLVPVGSQGLINLTQDVTFGSVNFYGTDLAPGTYTYATLNATYDSLFVDGGSGSITVGAAVPEPTGGALLLAAAGYFFLRRRRAA